MTQREKVLAGIVGAVVVVILNLVLISSVLKKSTRLRTELVTRQAELETMEALLKEDALWSAREAWLREKQPKLTNEAGAGVALLNWVKQLANTHQVVLENPAIGILEKTPFYASVPVNVEVTGPWPALVKFLHAVEEPGRFVVLETVNMQIDASDASKLRAKLKIAQWYAP